MFAAFYLLRRALAAAAVLLCIPALAHAQSAGPAQPAGPPPEQRCEVVPDTSRYIATPQQVAERLELRDSLVSVAKRHGVAAPRGLLFVLVDTTRKGRVLFLDSNLPDPAVEEAGRRVGEYLSTLESGRSLQVLVRIDGGYPAMAAGKRHCPSVVSNADEIDGMMDVVRAHHPGARDPSKAGTYRAVLRLVVNRDGGVSYVDVDRPSGDDFIDRYIQDIAAHLKFLPARLDGEPFDVRIRYTLTFVLG